MATILCFVYRTWSFYPSSLLMGFVWNQCHKLCFLYTYLPSLTTNAFHIYPPTNPPNSSTTRYVCIHRWPPRPSLFGNWDTNGCSTRWRNFFVFLVFCCCLLISLSLSLSLHQTCVVLVAGIEAWKFNNVYFIQHGRTVDHHHRPFIFLRSSFCFFCCCWAKNF